MVLLDMQNAIGFVLKIVVKSIWRLDLQICFRKRNGRLKGEFLVIRPGIYRNGRRGGILKKWRKKKKAKSAQSLI